MTKIITSEQDMLTYAEGFAKELKAPAVIELIGDVGAGKTTFTRGLAKGLGVKDPVTSPSFTISKHYPFTKDNQPYTLIHYDFYRLPDPGLMSDDLIESINDETAITVIEWADSVSDLLPKKRITLKITLNDDGSRTIIQQGASNSIP